VFNVIIEDQHVHRSLVRYVPDFIEFNRKVKKYYRKSGISLPRLVEPDLRLYSTGKKAAFRAFLNRLSRSRSAKPNSEKIELYLRRCALDPTIGSSSLFRDFLTRQRPEDKELPRLSPPELAENVHHSPCLRESLVETPASSSSVSQSPSGDQVQPHDRLLHHSNAARRQSMSIITYRSSDATEDFSMNRHQPSIDDYRFIQVLGRGCMGKVLLVQPYRLPSRLLALKAISKETVIEQREIVHTRMERDILTEIAKIRHPFLIKLHCAFQNTEQLFLLLDYHRGGDIATQLARHRTFSPRRSRLYAAEILMGLQELHRLGIIYRDLKPENILLASDGHIVLTDFGLSKQFEPHTNMDDQRTSTFCGTAEYLAPEILRQQPYTYAIDFWSLGMILYEMLEGITPFFSDSHSEMYRRILEDDLEFTDAFDDVTRYFIGGLLQRNPSERLGSGLEGPRTIRAHPYFLGLDWSDVYHKRIHPEYVPQLRSEADLSNFDKDFLDMTPRLSPVSNADLSSSALMDIFQGYSYIN
ncbi:kinase-like domain-containing protein, partial [Dichotomocladium elegans]